MIHTFLSGLSVKTLFRGLCIRETKPSSIQRGIIHFYFQLILLHNHPTFLQLAFWLRIHANLLFRRVTIRPHWLERSDARSASSELHVLCLSEPREHKSHGLNPAVAPGATIAGKKECDGAFPLTEVQTARPTLPSCESPSEQRKTSTCHESQRRSGPTTFPGRDTGIIRRKTKYRSDLGSVAEGNGRTQRPRFRYSLGARGPSSCSTGASTQWALHFDYLC